MKFLLLFPVLFLCTVNSHPGRHKEKMEKMKKITKECCADIVGKGGEENFQTSFFTCMVDKSRMVNDTNYKKIEEHTEKCKEILKNKTQEIIATDCSNEGINVAEKMKICWEEAKRKWVRK
ncbi:uncharacterized protein LOC111633465 [Centruroides sculpturatus]|uniref:uncharacterized protein LOC111633463 n=1 Tax=Centruroides sculpturatus TaxID=218467 RepID=UPI000C6E3073|nr:uncharacterized protein LOC111633463 [Centruroides sculpturatus]XP_023233801.1 uncharacterized protein LOC111633465 [Centruroides sculpturatus]